MKAACVASCYICIIHDIRIISFLLSFSAWTGSLYISLAYMFGPLVTRLIGRFGFRLTAIAGALLLSISFIALHSSITFAFLRVVFHTDRTG